LPRALPTLTRARDRSGTAFARGKAPDSWVTRAESKLWTIGSRLAGARINMAQKRARLWDNWRLSEREPLVTVLLPVKNAEAWVGDAIDSILRQSYRRLELLVIDNASTDKSKSVASTFSDKRLRILSQPTGHQVAALQAGLKAARGRIVARQDADDYSDLERIAKQSTHLLTNEHVGLVGCSHKLISLDGSMIGVKRAVTDSQGIRNRLLRKMPFAGASILGYKALFDTLQGYDPFFDGLASDDYDLLLRAAAITDLSALDEPLYVYRTNNPLSLCGRINYQYSAVEALVHSRARARGCPLFLRMKDDQ